MSYIKVICNQIKEYSKCFKRHADTVYFGGGTPNLIGEDGILTIIRAIKNFFGNSQTEISMEINPSDFHLINFKRLLEHGITRISVGIQSIHDNELTLLGRRHTSEQIIKCLEKIKTSGFNNISSDLMLAIPKQTNKSLIQSMDFLISRGIPHISAYLLKVEKGTPYFNMKEKLNLPDEQRQAELYTLCSKYLRDKGYKHYEISNFCIDRFQSVHNTKYWNCDEYLGLGPSAHSFINGKRFYFKRSLIDFLNESKVIEDGFGGNPEEYAMLRLRLSEGLINEDYKKRFGNDIPLKYYENSRKYTKCGLVICDKIGIRLTPDGFLVSNALILSIIS